MTTHLQDLAVLVGSTSGVEKLHSAQGVADAASVRELLLSAAHFDNDDPSFDPNVHNLVNPNAVLKQGDPFRVAVPLTQRGVASLSACASHCMSTTFDAFFARRFSKTSAAISPMGKARFRLITTREVACD